MTTLKAILPVLLACIHHAQVADAFSNAQNNYPPLKGSSSHIRRDASPLTTLRISNAERTDTINTKQPKTKKKQKSVNKSNTKPKYTSKKRGAQFSNLKVFNSQLTKCNSASELLGCFMEQVSSKGGLAKYDEDDSLPVTSAATHLAGANKVNGVNFSTCLHRLARFASNTNHHGEESDERKLALSDPRFALLLCSVAEMGARADASLTVMEGKEIVEQWERDSMMDINRGMKAADDVLSGIVGVSLGTDTGTGELDSHKSGLDESERKKELAEATMNQLTGPNKRSTFSSRECSNICWALAKIKIAPPYDAFPMGRVDVNGARSNAVEDERSFSSIDEMSLDVLSSSFKIRTQLFEEARKRKTGESTSGGGSWIPELARLAGKIMDLFAVQIIDDYASRKLNKSEVDNPRAKGYENRKAFNPQEMASCLWAFAKSQRADQVLFSAVAEELIRQTELMSKEDGVKPKPQEFSNTIWAFATAAVRGEAQVKLEKLLADAMDEGDGQFFGTDFKPQEFANTAWALATLHSKRTQNEDNTVDRLSTVSGLDDVEDDAVVRIFRWVTKNIQRQVHLYKPQELSNTVWASATIGFGYDEESGTNVHNDYVHVSSDNPEQDYAIMYETLETIAENVVSRLDKFKAQELNNLAWGYARLGHRTEKADRLFQGIADELTRRVHQFKPQDVGTTMWSLATVECQCPDAFRTGASRLNFKQIRLFKPQEMSNAVWALATAGFLPKYTHVFDTTLVPEKNRPTMSDIQKDPITECFAAVGGELMRRPQDFKDQEVKDVLWAFSRNGIRHPSLFKRVAEHIVGPRGRTFSTFSSQGIGNTLWSFARQGQLALDVIDRFGVANVRVGTTGRLAVYETSCLDVGEDLIKLLFARAAEAGMNMGLDRFRTQDLSNTCWAYSTLGLLHSGFFQQVEKQIMKRLKSRLSGQEIANILWAFATLNAQPDPAMIDALSSHIYKLCSDEKTGKPTESSISRLFKRQEIANVAWSCAVLGRYPKDLMNTLYQGMFGTNNDPQYMKNVFSDAGLQKSSVMTMYYVQYAADVEAPKLRLSLPKGFPNGWGVDGLGLSNDDNEGDLAQTSSSMLQLTISKLQRDVSESMTKIGFDNVLEYVIDAPTNQDLDDIATLPENEEFLSIDIANVEQRLGVEVDGPGHFVRLIDASDATYPRDSVLQWSADRGENRVNGPTLLKHRLLTALGWDIIHIPYWEYQNLPNDEDKDAYCRNLLDNYSSGR